MESLVLKILPVPCVSPLFWWCSCSRDARLLILGRNKGGEFCHKERQVGVGQNEILTA